MRWTESAAARKSTTLLDSFRTTEPISLYDRSARGLRTWSAERPIGIQACGAPPRATSARPEGRAGRVDLTLWFESGSEVRLGLRQGSRHGHDASQRRVDHHPLARGRGHAVAGQARSRGRSPDRRHRSAPVFHNSRSYRFGAMAIGLLFATAMLFAGDRSGNKPASSESGRVSSVVRPVGATTKPGVVFVTRVPGVPTPYWLFDETLAIQRVKEMTGTSDWVSHVAKRTTLLRAERLGGGATNALPRIEEDMSEPVWTIAWESSSPFGEEQVFSALGLGAPSEEAVTNLGTRAYMVITEIGHPVQGGMLNYVAPDSTTRDLAPGFFELVSELPEIPGSIQR